MAKKASKVGNPSSLPSSNSKGIKKATMSAPSYAPLSEFNELCRRFEVVAQAVPEIRKDIQVLRDQQNAMQKDITEVRTELKGVIQSLDRMETSVGDLINKDIETRYKLGTLEVSGSFFEKRWAALIAAVSAVITAIVMFSLQLLYDRLVYSHHISDKPSVMEKL